MVKFKHNLFAENPFEHMAEFDEVFGNVDQFRLQGLFARESQQLANQPGGTIGVLLNLDQVGKGRIADAVTLKQKPIMAVSRLLKSWATPPANWPMACIF